LRFFSGLTTDKNIWLFEAIWLYIKLHLTSGQ